MTRSRFTIYQTLIDIEVCKENILKLEEIEDRALYQSLDSRCWREDIEDDDPWVRWQGHKNSSYAKDDIIYYNSCIRKRMKEQKTLRLLEEQLHRLEKKYYS